MTSQPAGDGLAFPFPTPPAAEAPMEIAPGLLWARVPLPFQLDHVNVYLIDDGDGWAVLDTGIDTAATRALWQTLASGALGGRRLTRLIATHFHPDHIGLAGWICERFDMPLLTSQTSYLGCLNISLSPAALDAPVYRDFYLHHGLDAKTTSLVVTQGHRYLKMVTPLPPTFERVVAGDTLKIGSRSFQVMAGDGHAPEQLMFYCAAEKLFIAADQVLAKISPNVSVWAVDPQGDPLGLYLRSLRTLGATLPDDVLVLPGHQLPFQGLQARANTLIAHHEGRCATVAAACRAAPQSAADLVPVLFPRLLDPHQMSFAFSEVLAHMNFMLRQGALRWVDGGPVRRVVAT